MNRIRQTSLGFGFGRPGFGLDRLTSAFNIASNEGPEDRHGSRRRLHSTAVPAKQYRRDPRVVNAVVSALIRLGFLPHTYLLEVRGAHSGKLRTLPVTLVENGARWLVAPYGERPWVRNVRASGSGRLLRRGRAATVRFEEAGPEAAAPVLQRYWRQVPGTRPYFDVGAAPGIEDFRRVAPAHPVFRVTE